MDSVILEDLLARIAGALEQIAVSADLIHDDLKQLKLGLDDISTALTTDPKDEPTP